MGADSLETAAPEVADGVSARKNSKTAAKKGRRQTLKKQLGSGSRKRSASRVNPTKSANQTSRSQKNFLVTFLINNVDQISVPNFCGSFSKPWRKGRSS